MSPKEIDKAADLLHHLSRELTRLGAYYQWRPISEIHEDFGSVVLIDIDNPGKMAVGSNVNTDWDESEWTHFSRIVPLSNEDAERLRECR